MDNNKLLEANKGYYQAIYSKKKGFLNYPADWVIRFHNMYLKRHMPSGRVLDYGCGGGNNSIFFIEKGYEVYGVDVAEESLSLIKENLRSKNLDIRLVEKFSIISPDSISLPFENASFDFILSNQVLYFLPSEEHIKKLCKELSRCLRPGGLVFFTMMGPKNYYIRYHAKQIHQRRVYEVTMEDENHRLDGLRLLIYLVRDEDELRRLFSEFECITTGYFDQAMFDMKSNFHWIFVGRKNA